MTDTAVLVAGRAGVGPATGCGSCGARRTRKGRQREEPLRGTPCARRAGSSSSSDLTTRGRPSSGRCPCSPRRVRRGTSRTQPARHGSSPAIAPH